MRYVLVAEAVVLNPETGHLLMVLNDGKWWVPGGKVEPVETFLEAATRETLEETGVTITPTGILDVVERIGDDFHEVFVLVAADHVAGEPAPCDPDGKVTEVGWFPLDEAAGMMPDFELDVLTLPTSPTVPHFVLRPEEAPR